jgi:hypothetical protein
MLAVRVVTSPHELFLTDIVMQPSTFVYISFHLLCRFPANRDLSFTAKEHPATLPHVTELIVITEIG